MRLILFFTTLLLTLAACKDEYGDGALLYEQHCANCHMESGQGLGQLIPPLANSDYLQRRGALAACGIRYGLQGPMVVNGKGYEGVMPANKALSKVDIVNILNYINNSWGNEAPYMSIQSVEAALEQCPQAD